MSREENEWQIRNAQELVKGFRALNLGLWAGCALVHSMRKGVFGSWVPQSITNVTELCQARLCSKTSHGRDGVRSFPLLADTRGDCIYQPLQKKNAAQEGLELKRAWDKFGFAWSFPLCNTAVWILAIVQTSGEVQLCELKISVAWIPLEVILEISVFCLWAQCTSEKLKNLFLWFWFGYLIPISARAERNNNILKALPAKRLNLYQNPRLWFCLLIKQPWMLLLQLSESPGS